MEGQSLDEALVKHMGLRRGVSDMAVLREIVGGVSSASVHEMQCLKVERSRCWAPKRVGPLGWAVVARYNWMAGKAPTTKLRQWGSGAVCVRGRGSRET